MKISRIALLLALASVACGQPERKTVKLSDALPDLPLPPEASVIGRSAGADALKLTFSSTLTPEQMAEFYRGTLTSGVWRLVSDTKTADGTIALYAEREGPPMWVTIRKTPGTVGSTVELAGAVTNESKRLQAGAGTKKDTAKVAK
jgi:hypothetical protein